ncbi:hypothetical protein A7U60_g5980 [Sanghuangporus baumii]|uniref:Uncharacterized protein n=1 Tax=Sanghuangporus baumii TaxID=108892 RepID=A0A9Q5N2G6_SANBA|nr:hypothetical protein A7U60_g5980 [Sanghuangporus baumii]
MAGAKLINRQDQSGPTGSCGNANLLGLVVCAASTAGAKSTTSPDESTISCTGLSCSILPPSTGLATTFDTFSDPPPSTAATFNPSTPVTTPASTSESPAPGTATTRTTEQTTAKSVAAAGNTTNASSIVSADSPPFESRPSSHTQSGSLSSTIVPDQVFEARKKGFAPGVLLGSSLSGEHEDEDEENLEAMRAPISSKVTEKETKSVSLDSSSR